MASAAVAALLALTSLTTLWDRDEPRFAQAAVEMLASGDYLVPTFNGELRAQKPPLVYWLTTVSLRIFGQSELAARFWSPFGIGIAALATYGIGRRLWSPRVGLLAMTIVALTPLTLIEGVIATTDALLLAAVSVSMAVAAAMLTRPPRARDAVLLGLALGAGLLTKGPVALLVVVVVPLVCILARQQVASRARVLCLLIASTSIGICMYLAWLVPANHATAGQIVSRGLWHENLHRLRSPMEGHGTPLLLAPAYYPLVIVIAFFPWTLHLAAGVRRLSTASAWRSVPGAFLLTWILVPVFVFTLSATKLPHYILPIWPALALTVAAELLHGPVAQASRRVRRLLIVSMATAVVLCSGAAVADRFKPVPPVAAAIRRSGVGGPLFAYAFQEPSLVFYSRRHMVPIGNEKALLAWAHQPGEALLVAPRSAIDAAVRLHGPLPLRDLMRGERGWNYATSDALELVAFVRQPGR